MKFDAIWMSSLILICATVASVVHAQRAEVVRDNPQPALQPVMLEAPASGEAVRAISDPQTGHRWLLMRDRDSKGGPGHLVQIPATSAVAPSSRTATGPYLINERAISPVIHAGDHVVLEENTARITARLEAIALGSALNGAHFSVRLVLGGHVLRAVAMGPGRAVVAFGSGGQP